MLTFGIEEEFVLLDRTSLTPVPLSADVQRDLAERNFGSEVVQSEFLRSQVEFVSPVFTTFEEAAHALWSFRTALVDCAEDHGVLVAGVGTPFNNPAGPMVTADRRYQDIATSMGTLALEHHINGLHVHVGIPDRDVATNALNYLRHWLPTLLAMSANSPFWCGKDTTFASWRAIEYRRWTTAGCPPTFIDAADYDKRTQALIGIGITPDMGSVSWSARLSDQQPTVEIRVADAQLEPSTTLLLALLGRALVATSMTQPLPPPLATGPEMLDAALWHSARHGLGAQLVHPLNNKLAPASEVVRCLLRETRQALDESGDLAIVTALAEQLLLLGTGADRQRQAFVMGGMEGLSAFLSNAIKNESSAHQPVAGHLGLGAPPSLAG
ncbi:carboxylate-amine ligase [Arthrobacter glacialis]|uniref:carboxylate-amine ligase n=1 Tax=Arthrobacter glacialis TaxID=1664 RepID=UPI0013FD1FE0|nr:YbdK family carboxylate-amine ligase [Arthrobacter glacialis]